MIKIGGQFSGVGAFDQGVLNGFMIRRLTPRECFRLMDFPDTFTWTVSDSQAYKQAGNSIVVACLEGIIKNLKTLIPCKQLPQSSISNS